MSEHENVISDEAVEAATEALFTVFAAGDEHGDVDAWLERKGDRHIVDGRVNIPYAIRKVLEAAAPHMLADAWDACADLPSRPSKDDNPYRSKP